EFTCELDNIIPCRTCAQDNGQEFCIGEGLRAIVFESFTRPLIAGHIMYGWMVFQFDRCRLVDAFFKCGHSEVPLLIALLLIYYPREADPVNTRLLPAAQG